MADIKRDEHPAMIPGYGQPPEGVRTDHPELPDQGNRWSAETEGKPTRKEGSQGQNVEGGPDVPTPSRTEPDAPMPKQTPVEGP